MSTEVAMIPNHHTRAAQPAQLQFYIDAIGGVQAAALWLEVPQTQVRAWMVGAEAAPADTLFWLDDAFGDMPAPSGEE